ncbi:phosphoglycerate mutase family protein [Sphingosinicella sp. CPCC 101087]|uniref:phosphoglycerate mutase family protein n=1 Tax=Sphingosinicella sp. CPCC 101087 TaxID=2497754 RepID=UPI00101BB9A8|nr:phosphoglycerate mutase family protein [Sphingosinicella sp. CPCC 101087]
MSFGRLLAPALLALGAACATPAAAPPGELPIYHVVRHLHTPEGERDPDLTAEGHRQAVLLADRLAEAPPAVIYVSTYKRTVQTAAPTAARLDLIPIVYDPRDTPALVARVRAGPTPALVVGHSNTVPDIIEQLGGTRPEPLVHEDFGDLWSIRSDGTTERSRIDGEAAGARD